MADPAADSDPSTPAPAPYSPNAVHMLRTVQNNTLQLAQMADQKASILMGATLVVFSIAISRAPDAELRWSLTVLAGFAFLSALCCAVAVMPTVAGPDRSGRANRIFFGQFHAFDEPEWIEGLLDDLHDDEKVFRLMLRDIYQNGQVLKHRKYRFLGYAYRLFIAGLLATMATFAVEQALGL